MVVSPDDLTLFLCLFVSFRCTGSQGHMPPFSMMPCHGKFGIRGTVFGHQILKVPGYYGCLNGFGGWGMTSDDSMYKGL
ncbi:hypothetical protein AMTR_s00074p00105970 [Amborella trichopoda]|uniref:Uncharacterized protein n=1 Tax=Amborella trichopoda TaxID=13333 RepID=W1NQ54_AMBTC|nr:hypothetical protein AMTR_s00074p00105970 [Amborella trichopoda]